MKNQWRLSEYIGNKDEYLNGELLLSVLNTLSITTQYDFCTISGFDGGLDPDCEQYDLIRDLRNSGHHPHTFPSSEIKGVIRRIIVVDWGDFFFYNFKPNINDKLFSSCSYEKIISQTVFTIRVVDSEFIQVFTKESTNISPLGFMELNSTKCDTLESFDYPG